MYVGQRLRVYDCAEHIVYSLLADVFLFFSSWIREGGERSFKSFTANSLFCFLTIVLQTLKANFFVPGNE